MATGLARRTGEGGESSARLAGSDTAPLVFEEEIEENWLGFGSASVGFGWIWLDFGWSWFDFGWLLLGFRLPMAHSCSLWHGLA